MGGRSKGYKDKRKRNELREEEKERRRDGTREIWRGVGK